MYHYLNHSNNIAITRTIVTAFLIGALVFSTFAVPFYAYADEETSQESTEQAPEETPENTQEPEEPEEEEEPSEPIETIVETGDAVAAGDTINEVNSNEVNTNDTEPFEDLEDATDTENTENGTSTPETASSTSEVTLGNEIQNNEEEEEDGEPLADTVIETNNDATTTNSADVVAGTGDNSAGGDIVTIDTGDATAVANTVNVVNTNIINSFGFLFFLTQLFGVNTLDIRDVFNFFNQPDRPQTNCSFDGCSNDDTSFYVSNNNNAAIFNDVIVRSSTGGNSASGTDSVILTGDAYAGANVVNVVNTNIIDANYLLLSFTNLGDLFGDLILPNAEIFEQLFNGNGGASGDTTLTNNNGATTTNNVSVGASTGENSASSTNGDAIIETGDATAQANVLNMVNTNLFNQDSFMLMLRVGGDWNGDIYGLPDNISWMQVGDMITFYNTPSDFGATSQSTPSSLVVENNNDAIITNNVDVYAMTGGNSATGGEFAGIATGDAYAFANVLNIANTNILGRNWALLIFDILGDWNGSISFGQPDLWIAGSAKSAKEKIGPNADVEYTFTVTNFGDTRATGVELDAFFDELLMEFDEGETAWDIGTIEAGETVEISHTSHISPDIPFGNTPIPLEASVTSNEPEANPDDNNDIVTIMTSRAFPNIKSSGGGSYTTFDSGLDVSKSASKTFINPGDTVEYTIVIENTGGAAFDSLLVDTIYNEDDKAIIEKTWNLDTIQTDETVTVTYEVEFADDIGSGVYENSAQIYAYEGSPSKNYWKEIDSNIASVPVTIGGIPEVLGLNTDESCPAYITKFMRHGIKNDPEEVTKLQTFLNEHMGTSLPTDGIFGKDTDQAVHDFQKKHASDVLSPWGMNWSSGYVYLTTRKKINEIYCDFEVEFSLTKSQQNEIDLYRSGALDLHNNTTTPIPLFGEAEPEEPQTEEMTYIKEDDPIGDLDITTLNSDVTTQTTTPASIISRAIRHPFILRILRAFDWFKDLAKV